MDGPLALLEARVLALEARVLTLVVAMPRAPVPPLDCSTGGAARGPAPLELLVPAAVPPAAAVVATPLASGYEESVPLSLLKFVFVGLLEQARCPAMAARLTSLARSGDLCAFANFVREQVDIDGLPLQTVLDGLESNVAASDMRRPLA